MVFSKCFCTVTKLLRDWENIVPLRVIAYKDQIAMPPARESQIEVLS